MQTIQIRSTVVEFEYVARNELRVHSIEVDGDPLTMRASTAVHLACLEGDAFFSLMKILDEHEGTAEELLPKLEALPTCSFDEPCRD